MNSSEMNFFSDFVYYIKNNTLQLLYYNAFNAYFEADLSELTVDELVIKFDERDYKEYIAKAQYFIDNIKDFKKNINKYEYIYTVLYSEESKNALYNWMRAIAFMDHRALQLSFTMTNFEYSPNNLFLFGDEEIFVDGGAYDASTTLEFINHVPNYKKIYVCEPIEKTMMLAKCLIDEHVLDTSNISFVNKALSSSVEELAFFTDLNDGNHASNHDAVSNITVRADTIDNIVKDDKVTFIKLDIEGMELEAIKGAEKTIRANTPKLAICVYHKTSDLWLIFDKINEINSDYRFEFVQTCPHEYCDTVLFAVPKSQSKIGPISLTSKQMLLTNNRKELYTSIFDHRRKLLKEVRILNSQIQSRDYEKLLARCNKLESELITTKTILNEENIDLQNKFSETCSLVKQHKSINESLIQDNKDLHNKLIEACDEFNQQDDEILISKHKKLQEDYSELMEKYRGMREALIRDNKELHNKLIAIHDDAGENYDASILINNLSERLAENNDKFNHDVSRLNAAVLHYVNVEQALQNQIYNLNLQLTAVYNSTSFKVTKPLRFVSRIVQKIFR